MVRKSGSQLRDSRFIIAESVPVRADWQSLARRAWYESACYQGGDAVDVCQRQNSAGMDQWPRRAERSAPAGAGGEFPAR